MNTKGKPADYIPQLAAYGAETWGVALCTTDGQRYSLGDSGMPFTLQAISQVLTYAICLNELGQDRIHQLQGREPSGRQFNEIALDHYSTLNNSILYILFQHLKKKIFFFSIFR